MKRVLISGISGFLGARLAQRLQGKVELSGIVNREESDAECETLTLDLADTHLITDRLNCVESRHRHAYCGRITAACLCRGSAHLLASERCCHTRNGWLVSQA